MRITPEKSLYLKLSYCANKHSWVAREGIWYSTVIMSKNAISTGLFKLMLAENWRGKVFSPPLAIVAEEAFNSSWYALHCYPQQISLSVQNKGQAITLPLTLLVFWDHEKHSWMPLALSSPTHLSGKAIQKQGLHPSKFSDKGHVQTIVIQPAFVCQWWSMYKGHESSDLKCWKYHCKASSAAPNMRLVW